jgi:hypothetical protein
MISNTLKKYERNSVSSEVVSPMHGTAREISSRFINEWHQNMVDDGHLEKMTSERRPKPFNYNLC